MDDVFNKIDEEWLIINASKEILSLVKRKSNVTYQEAIKFAKKNSPKTFEKSTTGLGRKSIQEKLFDKYKQEAIALSSELETPKTAEELIRQRLNDLEKLLEDYPTSAEYPSGLKKERRDLKKLLNDETEFVLNLEAITEDQAIRNDVMSARPQKMFIKTHLGKYNVFRDNDTGAAFQIAILHPNRVEHITGADLIYEQYDVENTKVRIAAIQYKIWDKNGLYFSKSNNLSAQIKKLDACFCKKSMCMDKEKNNYSKTQYRLPYCTAFLRPTDKLQDPNKLVTSGYHIPICKLDDIKEKAEKSYIIRATRVKENAINSSTFEELFNTDMIGSRWLDIDELKEFYLDSGILRESENIIFHVQDISSKSKQYLSVPF